MLAAPAVAGDRNSVPPQIQLTADGPEGFVGPDSHVLAYFATAGWLTGTGGGTGSGGEYTQGSKVHFSCKLDGRHIRCPAHFVRIGRGTAELARAEPRKKHKRRPLAGPFEGYVPIPKHLPEGPHTVTVIATDEDGTQADPPTITVTMDRTPPSAPELTEVPPHRSRDHKPLFGFSASDDTRLLRSNGDVFTGSLRRLKPSPYAYRSDRFGGGFLGLWPLECPTLLTCSNKARAAYEAYEHRYSYGEDEWLVPGVYEFRIRARDLVGNESPLTTYRFRILRGAPG